MKEKARYTCMIMDPSEHQDLVNVITGVHKKLRKSLFLTGDPNKVWQDHIAEEDVRKSYSSAMLKLATEVWDGKECRIEWAYKTCIDYFCNGGLERSLVREKRIKEGFVKGSSEKISFSDNESCIEHNYKNINRKLKLLDIGSCYNPFSKFPEFSCVAIDLTPATKDVLQCDFLKLDIHTKASHVIEQDSELIFCEESFDIVVLSLVLEYLPASDQRAQFCFRAWKLLQQNGLLIIITPDSKSLHHNAPMMKSWKLGLEKIGFRRVKYDKLTHLHCMAFRKISSESEMDFTEWKFLSESLYIPQDFRTYDSDDNESIERTEEENCAVHTQFSELPNENAF